MTTAGVLVGAVALSWLFLSAFWDRTARRLACRGGGDPVVGLAIVATCTAFGALAWSNASSLAGATYHLRTGAIRSGTKAPRRKSCTTGC